MVDNLRIRNSVYALVVVSGVVLYSLAIINGIDISIATGYFRLLPTVVTIDLFLLVLFTKWGWKLKCFGGWLVPFPDLSGTWVGTINSDWVDSDTGDKVPPIPVMLTITQSFFHISFVMHTDEMTSASTSEGFTISSERQIRQVSYIYCSKPRISVRQRSAPHDGAIIFDIFDKPERKLAGRYWTERKTTGEIALRFHGGDILEQIPKNLGSHPMLKGDEVC